MEPILYKFDTSFLYYHSKSQAPRLLSLRTCEENVLAVKEKLRKEGIPLAGEVVGGSVGRSVEFDTASGIVTVRVKTSIDR